MPRKCCWRLVEKRKLVASKGRSEPRSGRCTIGLHDDRPKEQFAATVRIRARWLAQQQEVGSARIKYRRLFLGGSGVKPLKPDEVNTILTAAELGDRPEDFADAAQTD